MDFENFSKARNISSSSNKPTQLKRLLKFLLQMYVPWWFIDAPHLDLQLIKILYDLKKIVAVVAESALDKLELHLWYRYLTEMIPLDFFVADVPPEVHQ